MFTDQQRHANVMLVAEGKGHVYCKQRCRELPRGLPAGALELRRAAAAGNPHLPEAERCQPPTARGGIPEIRSPGDRAGAGRSIRALPRLERATVALCARSDFSSPQKICVWPGIAFFHKTKPQQPGVPNGLRKASALRAYYCAGCKTKAPSPKDAFPL